MRRVLAAAALATGCFAPEAREGLPCSERGDCPPGQSCRAGVCTSGAPLIDGSPAADAPAIDAALPDPPGPFGLVDPVALFCPGAIPCADVRDPFLNDARTAILFTYAVNAVNGNYDIYIAGRATPENMFQQAASIGPINTTVQEHTPFLSADGTTLWFARQDLSGGAPVRPYDQILVSVRVSGPFEVAELVTGGVNTVLGDERSPQVMAGGQVMLFTRAPEKAPEDHDVYLARHEGGQWNTIELVRELSVADANERSVAVVEERKAIFFIRGDQIHEAIWTGEEPTDLAVAVVHHELDASRLDAKSGVWASPDGTEVWFDSNRTGAQQIYRAVRPPPTSSSSGGRTWRRPIP